MMQRRFLAAIAIVLLPASTHLSSAQTLAGKQIRLIVPFPAGGPTDIVARPLAQFLGDALKATVIVDNRGGAGGSLGADAVAKSAPDGTTLLMATVGTHAINSALYKKLPYDAVTDFTPIALVAAAPVAIVVHPSLPANTLAEFVALAKSKPGTLTYGSAGYGTPGHLTGEMFKRAAGIEIQHIPYKGSAPAISDLIGGQIMVMFDPLQSVLSNVQSGKLRPIAISSKSRSAVLPQVPSIAESGYDDFETMAWWAVFAPAHLPSEVTAALAATIAKVVHGVDFHSKLEPLGVVSVAVTGDKFVQFQKSELEKWGKAVRDSGATME